ncbi:hypothetical protein ARMSODRAFT_966962, partial [Armillaria solidipes]
MAARRVGICERTSSRCSELGSLYPIWHISLASQSLTAFRLIGKNLTGCRGDRQQLNRLGGRYPWSEFAMSETVPVELTRLCVSALFVFFYVKSISTCAL